MADNTNQSEKSGEAVPDWLNNDFFHECLQKEFNKPTIVVTGFSTSTVVPPGNNYGSYIIRAKVNYKYCKNDVELKTISLIVKSEHTDTIVKESLTDFQKNEPFFYYKFLSSAKKFSDTSFAPKSFFSSRPTVTVLEDLKEKGFIMADRIKQLDFDHCRMYLSAAASMHAVSVAVFKDHPEILEQAKSSPMYDDDKPQIRDLCNRMITGGIKLFLDEMEKIDRYKKYCELLKKISTNLWHMMVEAHKQGKGVNSIRQGDPWTTNMLFKYDKQGKVCDIKLVDFQAIQYSSPAADIVFFIWTSANNDVKKSKLEELYRIYVDTFNAKLQQCKCEERLSYQQFTADAKRLTPLVVYLAVSINPIFIHSEPMDFSMLLSKDNEKEIERIYRKYYNDDYCNNYLPNLFECLEVNGIFDYLMQHDE